MICTLTHDEIYEVWKFKLNNECQNGMTILTIKSNNNGLNYIKWKYSDEI